MYPFLAKPLNISLSAFAPENLISRDEIGSPVPRQPARLYTRADSGACLRDSSRVPRRRPFIYLKPPYAIGSVPSLSGHAIASRWRSLPIVRRHRASKGQGRSERVLPWQVTMDQLICSSLSHTHYWYEVGMLKVPANGRMYVELWMDQRGMIAANPARSEENREHDVFPLPAPVCAREFGSARWARPSRPVSARSFSTLNMNLVLTYRVPFLPPAFHDGVPVLSTCPLHTNSGCGKERRILLVHGDLPRQHSFGTTLRFADPVPADSRQ